MRLLASFAVALFASYVQGCVFPDLNSWGNEKKVKGSSTYVTKNIRIGNFDKISLTGSCDIDFTQREGKPQVEIYTSDNLVDLVDVHVDGNTLKVGIRKGYQLSYKVLKVRVSAPHLKGVSITGSGDVTLQNELRTEHLQFSVTGAGDISAKDIVCKGDFSVNIVGSGDIVCSRVSCGEFRCSIAGVGDISVNDLTAGNVNASVTGSGDIVLNGHAETAYYKVSGSGDLKASDLKARRVEASISGSGDISCHASDYLRARVSGSGTIGYGGNPKEVDIPNRHIHKL